MDGTLLDVTYAPPSEKGAPGQAVVWVKDDAGRVHRIPEPFTPLLYARADRARLRALEGALPPGSVLNVPAGTSGSSLASLGA